MKYTLLNKGDVLANNRGSITCEYLYDYLYILDEGDELQRFGKVKIEATSFTVSEPTQKILIAPYLYELANDQQKFNLINIYEVSPFEIETITLERIFIDKVFAAQFYFERNKFSDVAKHLYDITVLLNNENIKKFLQNKEKINQMIMFKRDEEKNRKGGVSEDSKISSFDYFTKLSSYKEFGENFRKMQEIYVLNENDKLELKDVYDTISKLHDLLRGF